MSCENKRVFMSGEEKVYLKERVREKSDIIECKKTDAITIAQKRKAWLEITADFNANSEFVNRTVEQLRKCWENLKARRRKILLKEAPNQDLIDAILDDTTSDIEVKHTIDDDSVALLSNSDTNPDHDYYLDEEYIMFSTDSPRHEDLDVTVDSTPGTSKAIKTQQTSKRRRKRPIVSRGYEAEAEYRTMALRIQEDEELHFLRMKEQQLKVEEQEVKVAIAQEILKQERIKTRRLQKGDL